MRHAKILVLVTVLAALVAGAARAEGIFRFGGAWVSPTGDLADRDSEREPLGDGTTLVVDAVIDIAAADALGLFAGYEHRLSDRLGVDFNVLWAEPDVDFDVEARVRILDDATGAVLLDVSERATATGDAEMIPVTVGLNVHFGGGPVDVYAGPFVGYVFYGDLTVSVPAILDGGSETLRIDDDFTYGAVFGVDVPFGQGAWAFSAAARYLVTEAQPEDDGEALDIDPVIVTVGLGYRF